jgi:acylphosphatase
MKKNLLAALTMLFTLAFLSTAFADPKKFTDFSVEVPAGWEATEDTDAKGLKTAILTNAKKKITVMIGVEPFERKTLKQTADEFAKQVKGTVQTVEGGNILVTYEGNDGDATVLMSDIEDGRFFGAAIVGDVQDSDVDAIMNSLQLNNEKE